MTRRTTFSNGFLERSISLSPTQSIFTPVSTRKAAKR